MSANIMLANYTIVVDKECEVYELMSPLADREFWDLDTHTIIPNAVYMIGRIQFEKHSDYIKELVNSNRIRVILSNPSEGSDTMRWQLRKLNVEEMALEGKILILAGGDMEPTYPYLSTDSFMTKILNYVTNRSAMKQTHEIFSKLEKPYKFLFLNGRARPHRKYLLETFRMSGLLEQALWTNLDTTIAGSRHIKLMVNNDNLLLHPTPVHLLPVEYEVPEYQLQIDSITTANNGLIKNQLFNNTWGEIYLNPAAYIDTYFSLVSETVFEYPYSFRTEKIWKPITMGHPWMAVSSAGYYRDIRNMGFKTFNHLIDESFDSIDSNQARIDRIAQLVQDLCNQDLQQFLIAAEDVCKYNQQHLIELAQKENDEFPLRFTNFITQHFDE